MDILFRKLNFIIILININKFLSGIFVFANKLINAYMHTTYTYMKYLMTEWKI